MAYNCSGSDLCQCGHCRDDHNEFVNKGCYNNGCPCKEFVMMEEKSKEEVVIEKKVPEIMCKCGHPKNMHNRFVEGRFIACQAFGCDCYKFQWLDPQ